MWDGDSRLNVISSIQNFLVLSPLRGMETAWERHIAPEFGSRSSKPTVWDGDFLLAYLYLWLLIVSSPLCGMETKSLVFNLIWANFRFKPTVWDGDLAPNTHGTKCFPSFKPTVWDGDVICIG